MIENYISIIRIIQKQNVSSSIIIIIIIIIIILIDWLIGV